MGLTWHSVDLTNDEPEHYDLDPADLPSLEELLHRPAWHADAACRGEGPDRWFPTRGESVDAAKAICAGCLVREECFAAGLRQKSGIWAGLSERQRRAARRQAAA